MVLELVELIFVDKSICRRHNDMNAQYKYDFGLKFKFDLIIRLSLNLTL